MSRFQTFSRRLVGWRQRLAGMVFASMLVVGNSQPSEAFCGFYVAQTEKPLYNAATQVVMMRDKNLTVLSMENNYEGPLQDFAMVVPVPIVLLEKNVKTLDRNVFQKIDTLDSPRLVEYWEQDPCAKLTKEERERQKHLSQTRGIIPISEVSISGVTVEAQFKVGEYEVVVLGASDSSGLESWLHQHHYKIPQGASTYLRPYVAKGSKFFVAKVNSKKVKVVNGRVRLSPLRFHYNSDEFSLPIRLGLINAQGKQELIIHILSPGKRFEVANYPNAMIPTNLSVSNDVRSQFGTFYTALFDKFVKRHPKSVVTEYAWDARSCDPCPSPPLEAEEIQTLGGDVLPEKSHYQPMVLTRLHARYSKKVFTEDLVFKEAKAIVGGREVMVGSSGIIEQGYRNDHTNNFQARYAIRHAWQGKLTCSNPVRGYWGGPPSTDPAAKRPAQTEVASDIAFAKRGPIDLASLITQPVPELGLPPAPKDLSPPKESPESDVTPHHPAMVAHKSSGCAGCSYPHDPSVWPWVSMGLIAAGWCWRRRRSS
jgi:hypothetical protein